MGELHHKAATAGCDIMGWRVHRRLVPELLSLVAVPCVELRPRVSDAIPRQASHWRGKRPATAVTWLEASAAFVGLGLFVGVGVF